ncbi:MAG: ribosome biogenesis GTPase YlqF [Clostridia bacterium]|nr:ribosome biogenesis GTPase YlqF [Clostridia bacterium]
MNVQWFPGHMAKTRRMMSEQLGLIDIVVELLDARLPLSSQNPEISNIIGDKPRLIILNKADLADDAVNQEWVRYFKEKGIYAILLDSVHAKNLNFVADKIRLVLKDKLEKQAEKGMSGRSVKVMVAGIPNVGKSSFINKLAGRASAITGDRPGVTRGKQWIRLKNGIELLDTPGILWPKFEDEETGLRLAYVGSIKDEIMDVETLASKLLEFLNSEYKEELCARYKLSETENLMGYELIEMIGKKRGFVISGGEIDLLRAANIVLDEFRSSKIGKISLERPNMEE